MPAKRYLADYVAEYGFDPKGIPTSAFDEAAADSYITISCAACGRKFATKKRDLVQRFRRSGEDSKVSRCLSCVNADNRKRKP